MNLSQDELRSQLRGMDEYEFEQLVADVWEQRGWETTVTTGSSDRGIDVIAEKSSPFDQKHLIQAKRYSAGNKIGSPDIQQYSSLRQQEDDVDAVVVVTTSSFSSQARQTAKDLNVKLINGDDLSTMISEIQTQELVSDYFQTETGSMESQITNTEHSTSNPSSSKNKTSRYSSHPFDSDSVEPTRDHKYFSKCPICGGNDLRDKKVSGDMTVRCGECKSAWESEKVANGVGGYSISWRGISGEPQGMLKSTSEWVAYSNNTESQSSESTSTGNGTEHSNPEPDFFDKLVIFPTILFILSIVHSLFSFSIHSYQVWLLVIIVMIGSASAINKQRKKVNE